MKTTKLVAALAAAGLGWVLSAPVNADPTFFSPVTTFEDDNLDFMVDNDGDGTLSQGDRLISVAEWTQTSGILGGQGPDPISPPEELTAVSDITILNKIATATPGVFNYVFGPSGGAGVLAAFAPGTTVAVFLDGVPDLDVINSNCGTRANCQTLAGLGLLDGSVLYATAGFTGDQDEYWLAFNTADSLAAIQTANATAALGSYNFAQNFIVNNTGRQFGVQGCDLFAVADPCGDGIGDDAVQVAGQGTLLGGQGLLAAEWTGRTDTDFQVVPIPEPGSLALLGAALLGAGAVARRKARK